MLYPKRGEWGFVALHGAKDAHWTAAPQWVIIGMQDVKASDRTLSLLQEHFWWPGMAKQMRQVIKACRHCFQYEGGSHKAPLCPIVATAPLDLLHVDFTSIETMMELNQSPRVANVLVFQDHFTKHVLAYVTHNLTEKTIAIKFLYGGLYLHLWSPSQALKWQRY